MRSDKRGALLVGVVILLSAFLGGMYGPSARATAAGASDLSDSVKSFNQVLTVVQQNYAIPVDTSKVVYDGAIPGLLRTLDPHSIFFDPHQWSIMMEDEAGRYYGVGMTIVQRTVDNKTMVISPFVGSPAYKAGIRPGDIIVKVDDKSTDNLDSTAIADMLKGPKGTTVHISMAREGWAEPISFTVVRDEIPRHDVDDPIMIRPNVGYIRLTGFNETTGDDFAQAFQGLLTPFAKASSGDSGTAVKQLNPASLSGLILDLRGNPGGVLNSAIAVCDMLLDKNQLIVSQRGRRSPYHAYYALHGNNGMRIPVVVLIDSGSASASEIVTGAIQDHDRGIVLGEVSFGKGLVQSVGSLSEGTGLALTTAHYYTPSGRLIQRDYHDVSFFDYEFNREATIKKTEIKLTDSGRQVYGGGGITPDVNYPTSKATPFQMLLERPSKNVFFGGIPSDIGVGDFTTYFLGTKPTITKNFTVDDSVMAIFKKFLQKRNIPFTDQDIADNLVWIKNHIKREVFTSMYGQMEGFRVETEVDPEVAKAIDLLPQSRALYENARRMLAERTSSPGSQQNPH
jgi:carboxyl-terminal processing protease